MPLDGDGGSRILTWGTFFLGGDANAPVNAQIVLWPNGDFITCSNDVETVCRRVNLDDWDDDGIHNVRDANQTSHDGYCRVKNMSAEILEFAMLSASGFSWPFAIWRTYKAKRGFLSRRDLAFAIFLWYH